jgi:hypothetical protein
VSDAALRALLREAKARGDGPSWLRAAGALARAAWLDAAGHAALHARALGEAVEPTLDALAGPLAAIAPRELGQRHALAKLSHLAWAPDGRTVLAADDRRALVAFDVASGAARDVAPFASFARALALDAAGDELVCVAMEDRAPDAFRDVALVDLAQGSLRPLRLGEQGRGIVEARRALRRAESAFVLTPRDVCAFPVDGPPRRAHTWRVTAPLLDLDARGVVALKNRKLHFHDLLAAAPRAKVDVDVRREADPSVHALGRRGLVVDDHATLVADDGQVLARRALPALPERYLRAASPSGARLAFLPAGDRRYATVHLLDVWTGEARTVEAPARVRDLAWSPSGARLALTTDLGTVLLLEAEPAPAPPPTDAADDAPWTELRSGPMTWRARRQGTVVQVRYGRDGNRPTARDVPCDDEAAADAELARRVRAKRREGYAPG